MDQLLYNAILHQHLLSRAPRCAIDLPTWRPVEHLESFVFLVHLFHLQAPTALLTWCQWYCAMASSGSEPLIALNVLVLEVQICRRAWLDESKGKQLCLVTTHVRAEAFIFAELLAGEILTGGGAMANEKCVIAKERGGISKGQ